MILLVSRIVQLRPDVLIVGGTASRIAQELLFEHNVSLVFNVKASLMRRIARMTRARILPSIDCLDASMAPSDILGTCGLFVLRTFGVPQPKTFAAVSAADELKRLGAPVTEANDAASLQMAGSSDGALGIAATAATATVASAAAIAATAAASGGVVSRSRCATFMFFEDCPAALGCTVYLRGASIPVLKEVKKVVQRVVHVAYSLKLETALLFDQVSSA